MKTEIGHESLHAFINMLRWLLLSFLSGGEDLYNLLTEDVEVVYSTTFLDTKEIPRVDLAIVEGMHAAFADVVASFSDLYRLVRTVYLADSA